MSEIRPNVAEPHVAAGFWNAGVFDTLKNSERNWTRWRSLMLKFLRTERSIWTQPGPCR